MAWIESHQDLERHPKVADLMIAMGWDLYTTLGRLHCFWWWCVDYAEDGDLRKHGDGRIAKAMGVPMVDSKRLVEAMIAARWLDRQPYFRVHDWWEYVGRFLQVRYGRTDPDKWKRIRDLYHSATLSVPPSEITNQPTNQPNQPDARAREGGSDAGSAVLPGERTLPTLDMAKKWLADWTKSGADYTESELKGAFLALQASGWMWGKNPVIDYRAALERQIQTDRGRTIKNENSTRSGNNRNAGTYNEKRDTSKLRSKVR